MDILIILALILLNGAFAMAELALVSAKRVRLEKMAGEGSGGARAALQLADDPSALLSTVQVGITLIAIFNGAFGEARLVAALAPQLGSFPPPARTAAFPCTGAATVSRWSTWTATGSTAFWSRHFCLEGPRPCTMRV